MNGLATALWAASGCWRTFGVVAIAAAAAVSCEAAPRHPTLRTADPPLTASTSNSPGSVSTPIPAAPTEQTVSAPKGWLLGAKPLPKGPDGQTLVLPTPAELRDRRLATPDRLAPPGPDAPYRSGSAPIDAALAARMGTSWAPGCPIPLSGLRHLTLSFWGFDGRQHTGELVVSATVADDVGHVFGRLFAAHFPIEEMRVVETADLTAEPTGDGNTTAGFVCRPVRGTASTPSAHSFGLAVDINPFQNPYHRGDLVLPELASAYLDRRWVRPGMITKGDIVTRAFAEVGWTWGGSWSSTKDLMHFSANGR